MTKPKPKFQPLTLDHFPVKPYTPKGRRPYGYILSEDKQSYHMDTDFFPFLQKAFEYINGGMSLRDAAQWLTRETDFPVTHATLSNIWQRVYKDQENARNARMKTWDRTRKTPQEREKAKLMERRRVAKRSLTIANKQIDKLTEKTEEKPDKIELTDSGVTVQEKDSLPQVIFKPNPGPQTEFLSAPERQILYGGAAGGEPKVLVLRLLSEQSVKINFVNCWNALTGESAAKPLY